MGLARFGSTLLFLVLTAVPLAAQTPTGAEGSMPSAVYWAAAIAGFFGFIVGSTDRSNGWRFDFPGAVVMGFASALLVGGGAHVFLTHGWTPGVYAAGLGLVMAAVRIANTR